MGYLVLCMAENGFVLESRIPAAFHVEAFDLLLIESSLGVQVESDFLGDVNGAGADRVYNHDHAIRGQLLHYALERLHDFGRTHLRGRVV